MPMKRLFRRKSTPESSHQTFQGGTQSHWDPENPSEQAFDHEQARRRSLHSLAMSDAETLRSWVSSDAETLTVSREERMEFQPTYSENFTNYLPFVLRRQRAESAPARVPRRVHTPEPESDEESRESDSDDEKTIVSKSEDLPVMQRSVESYSHMRTMVVATELIRNTMFLFPNEESFKLFRELRSHNKKSRRKSFLGHDETTAGPRGSALHNLPDVSLPRGQRSTNQPHIAERRGSAHGMISPTNSSSGYSGLREDEHSSASTSDTRSHIIPLEYKANGTGLPLFKIVVPYMSSFRKRTPFMIFRRYYEVPRPPPAMPSDEEERYETYDFCNVFTKSSQNYKRHIFHFKPEGGSEFRVLAFQNNYRPFTDFNYKKTRFRVFGTSINVSYLSNYNPELKVFILDDDQPSLMDCLIDKNKNDGLSRGKRSKSTGGSESPTEPGVSRSRVPEDFVNPVPSPENPIIKQNMSGLTTCFYNNYVPSELPPFSRCLDACAYVKSTPFLPKKYSETAKMEVYEDLTGISCRNKSSTLSVELDSLVLATVLLTLRETCLRTSVKHPSHAYNSRIGLISCLGAPGSLFTN